MKVARIAFEELEVCLTGNALAVGGGEDSVEVDADLPDGCFALDLSWTGMSSGFGGAAIAVFSTRFGEALDRLYLFRKAKDAWFLCRLVRTESGGGASAQFRPSRRKSFMTPTPLHIPGSRVSPIPDYTHAVFYLEPVNEKRIELVKAGQTHSLFPLVHLERVSGET